MKMKLTPEIIHAIGWDAGDRSMKQAGRIVWNYMDLDAAVKASNKLWDIYDTELAKQWETVFTKPEGN